jgi:hypothetical protein
MEQIGD